MNNVIMKTIAVNGGWQALSALPLIGSVTISCPPSNSGVVYFQGDGGAPVPWQRGEWHEFKSVNLASIKVMGNPGDIVTVVGGTWWCVGH